MSTKAGQVHITLVGTVGVTAIAPREAKGANVARAVGVVPVLADVGAPYVSYALRLPVLQELIAAWCNTTVQATLNLKELARVPIPVPPKAERDAITALFQALEDKLALNRRMNQTLEAAAAALFRSWFVDFDPIVAKSEGRRAISVTDAIQQALPSSFIAEGDLQVPEGWVVTTIGDKLTTVLGGTPSRDREEFWTGGTIPWINSGRVNEHRIIVPSELITDAALRGSNAKVMPRRTTLVAITGATLGKVSLLEIEACGNQSIVGILPSRDAPGEFVYFWLREQVPELLSRQTGAAQQHVNKNDVNALPLILPSSAVMDAFVDAARPMFDRIAHNCFESLTLSRLRDTLLPQVLSGAIRLGEAERTLAAAL